MWEITGETNTSLNIGKKGQSLTCMDDTYDSGTARRCAWYRKMSSGLTFETSFPAIACASTKEKNGESQVWVRFTDQGWTHMFLVFNMDYSCNTWYSPLLRFFFVYSALIVASRGRRTACRSSDAPPVFAYSTKAFLANATTSTTLLTERPLRFAGGCHGN